MSTIKIEKDDPARILLTEVLPYEVPILFSNEGFYRFVVRGKRNPPILLEIFKKKVTIPFNYKIRKSRSENRTLSVMHPGIQKEFVDFYRDYDALIIDLCKRSPFTLRAPSRVASWFILRGSTELRGEDDGGVETDYTERQLEQKHASSYFVYSKFDFLYKFFESYEFHGIEKKFSRLLTFDISKCFPSIYSHTIAWAVKDKLFAKQNIGRTGFESTFDQLMQRANYKETNGIIIGPEISRIFAEIILQRIDLEVLKGLGSTDSGALRPGRDYAVRRYVDDYFVFTNREEVERRIYSSFQAELEKFRMFVNNSKTRQTKVPFITEITAAKTKIKSLLEYLLNNLAKMETGPTHVPTDSRLDPATQGQEYSIRVANIIWPHRMASKMIMELKSAVKAHGVEYDSVSAVILKQMRTWLFDLLKERQFIELGKIQPLKVRNTLWVVLDVVFFIYSMDPRVRCTFIVSWIVVRVNAFLMEMPNEVAEDVRKKMFDESIRLIHTVQLNEGGPSVEVLNLLIAMRALGKDYLLDKQVLVALLKLDSIEEKVPHVNLNYFQIVTVLYYVRSTSQYRGIRNGLERIVLQRLRIEQKPFDDAELTCLFFDVIGCPYIRMTTKRALVAIAYRVEKRRLPSVGEISEFIRYAGNRNWFTNWSKRINLEQLLMKKELRQAYA